MGAEASAQLGQVLEQARALGFLGPGPIDPHVEHARALAGLFEAPPRQFADLGSGGGVPGLVLAGEWVGTDAGLIDASARRCSFLRQAVVRLGLAERVEVVCGRAEELGREPGRRGAFEMVVARAFGCPAVTAECAAPLLRRGGLLVVSEPPARAPGRWDAAGLGALGLGPPAFGEAEDSHFVIIEKVGETSDRWPRRTGVPSRRPLWP